MTGRGTGGNAFLYNTDPFDGKAPVAAPGAKIAGVNALKGGADVLVLQGQFANAGAQAIADNNALAGGAGVFIYHNSTIGVNRLLLVRPRQWRLVQRFGEPDQPGGRRWSGAAAKLHGESLQLDGQLTRPPFRSDRSENRQSPAARVSDCEASPSPLARKNMRHGGTQQACPAPFREQAPQGSVVHGLGGAEAQGGMGGALPNSTPILLTARFTGKAAKAWAAEAAAVHALNRTLEPKRPSCVRAA